MDVVIVGGGGKRYEYICRVIYLYLKSVVSCRVKMTEEGEG